MRGWCQLSHSRLFFFKLFYSFYFHFLCPTPTRLLRSRGELCRRIPVFLRITLLSLKAAEPSSFM